MIDRDARARMLRRARRYRRMARDALKASYASFTARASLLVIAEEWYSLALMIENSLPAK
ncbi:MAG TPA: hypothetical protein VGG10_13370 [Rhizomicrobium sp.]|jgi:hypothetical protein